MTDKKRKELFKALPEKLELQKAKEMIDGMLEKYSETCKIEFRETDAEIIDSYLVDSQDDRHIVCEIIARTGITQRDCEDMAAEWQVHNVAYYAGVGKSHAKDVSLDYGKDPRASVRLATAVFDKLNIE